MLQRDRNFEEVLVPFCEERSLHSHSQNPRGQGILKEDRQGFFAFVVLTLLLKEA